MIIIMKTLYHLRDYKINVRKLIEADNQFFLDYLRGLMEKGCKYQVKSCDSFIDEFMKTVRYFCEYGEDLTEQVL